MSRDLACGGLSLALAVAYYLAADRLPVSLLADAVGADGVPKSLAVALALLALALLTRAAVLRPTGGRDLESAMRIHPRALGVLGLGAAYVAAAPVLGYPLTIALLIAATAAYFGLRADLRLAGVAALGAVLFWALFAKLLSVAMPVGIWPRLIG